MNGCGSCRWPDKRTLCFACLCKEARQSLRKADGEVVLLPICSVLVDGPSFQSPAEHNELCWTAWTLWHWRSCSQEFGALALVRSAHFPEGACHI